MHVGERRNVHPRKKKPVGERLALQAMKKSYGVDLVCDGPLVETVRAKDVDLEITFTSSAGLKLASGTQLQGFSVEDEQGVWRKVKALIEGAKVVLPGQGKKKRVRYGWSPYPQPALNLVNGASLPASPFEMKVGE